METGPDLTTEPLVYSIAQAAEVLGLSEWQVGKAVRSGTLPKVSPAVTGRRVLIPVQGLKDYLASEGTVQAGPNSPRQHPNPN